MPSEHAGIQWKQQWYPVGGIGPWQGAREQEMRKEMVYGSRPGLWVGGESIGTGEMLLSASWKYLRSTLYGTVPQKQMRTGVRE